MNVQVNRTEKINKILEKINILFTLHVMHNSGYCIIPFKFIIANRDAKQYCRGCL